MDHLITNPNQVTADMLTELFYEKGCLLHMSICTARRNRTGKNVAGVTPNTSRRK